MTDKDRTTLVQRLRDKVAERSNCLTVKDTPSNAVVIISQRDVIRAADEIERLTRELAEAQRDAERYRWLKKNATDIKFQGRHVVSLSLYCLDAAIDAAMATAAPSPERTASAPDNTR